MMAKYDKVGGGSFGVYRKRRTDWSAVAGGLVLFFLVIVVLANL